jgi:hypothetical protein
MTHQEFADTSTKLKREQVHENFMKESEYKRGSLQDEIEANRRQTMTGQAEAWRQGAKGSVGLVPSQSDIPTTMSLSENAVNLSLEATTDGLANAEENLVPKRSGYVDVGRRLVTGTPHKSADDEVIEITQEDRDMADRENVSEYPEESHDVASEAPDIVDLLSSSKSSNKTSSEDPLLPSSLRLICDDGSTSFSIVHPGSSPIQCFAAVTDRYFHDKIILY